MPKQSRVVPRAAKELIAGRHAMRCFAALSMTVVAGLLIVSAIPAHAQQTKTIRAVMRQR